MGDVKVNEDSVSLESSDAPTENGTNIPEAQNNEENKEVAETEKESKESENSLPTKMEVDEDNKLSSDDKEAEEVPSKEIPPVSKRKSRSSRSSSSNSLPPNVSPKQMESEDTKGVISKAKNEEQSENARVNVSDDEADFFGFESPADNDRCSLLIKRMNRLIESFNQVEESDDFIGFETDTSDIQSKSNDVDSVDSHADVTMNETEYTEGLMAPLSTRKTPRSVKKSVNVDLSNPEFKKPFEYGWIRELVYRSTSDSNIRRNADIYYYTPGGKKVRSSREILEYLSGSDLTLDNFTFFKEPIGLNDPSKEIIREAKAKPGPRGLEDGTPPVKKLTPKVKLTTPSTPSNASKFSSPKENTKASLTPKVVFKGNTATKNRINSGKNKLDKKRKSAGPDDVDIIMESAEWSPDQKINPTRDVCSIECRLAMGLIPTLQCHKCLCLYHPECVGLQKEKLKPSHSYACKNCQVMKSPPPPTLPPPATLPPMASLPPPPPLTPIVPVSRASKSTMVTSSGSTISSVSTQSATVNSRSGGIVGAVTTWLAPSSSIQVAPQEHTMASTDSPQGLVSLNGRPFLFIPKHNVVNVVNSQQSSIEGGEVSNPPSLFLVPCDPPPKQLGAKGGDPSPTQLTNGVKRPLDLQEDDSFPPPEKKQKQSQSRKQGSQSPDCVSSQSATKEDGPNFMQNLNAGFIGLLHTFQYLKVYELLRAACVSRMWNFVASHTSLWETVRMKNSKVRDWNGFGRTLLKHGTRTLDLRKMIVPDTIEEQVHMWEELSQAVKNVKSLTKVDMGRCSPAALSLMAEAVPQLKSLVSLAISWKERNSSGSQRRRANELDLAPFTKLTNLTELKLKAAQNGIELKNFECLKELKNLTSLALTTVKNLDGIEEYLPTGLVSLELGECSTLSTEMATQTLPKLTNLVRLRLEKGQNDCPTIALLNAIAGLPNLVQLELINFDVKPGFDKALSKCTNIQTLLIIPTYVTQSATTNHVVMGGVAKLSHSLNYFIWGLTLELLKVTDLFIGQVENQKGNKPLVPKKGSGDSIPILKPATDGEPKEGGQPSQVDILALPNLQRVLTTLLPQTKIKILKVPFSATWRQTVTDA
ncbi:uncharacterized protein [Halyomorpha halys]|uniref:uncharacterized protein isoform X2 n=1 Tax=Halyomorpha halys TaxID=286706 RepID=UPI0006D52526|nr:uncharacterized protein LOC106687657 isoform X2 [Halyomorpha halys]